MRRTEKEAVGISFTPTCHTHTQTQTHTHTNTHRTHTQPVPNHTSSDPGLRSFQTVHICSTVILHTACVTVCVFACYPVVFLCKSHISGPQTHSGLTKSTKTKTGHEHLTTASIFHLLHLH